MDEQLEIFHNFDDQELEATGKRLQLHIDRRRRRCCCSEKIYNNAPDDDDDREEDDDDEDDDDLSLQEHLYKEQEARRLAFLFIKGRERHPQATNKNLARHLKCLCLRWTNNKVG